jgi:pimeloyl-ACP methyl ester carboxylesterase
LSTKSAISSDGVEIDYDVVGDGAPTIVFVHGWSCNRAHWRDQVAAFSDRFRVIAIDLAGHGESKLGRGEYSMESFARDVEVVLDAEGVERALLVGHSMGGMVIVHAARLLGERVVGIVGADTFKFIREDPRTGKQFEQWRSLARPDGYEAGIDELVSSMFTADSPVALQRSIADGMVGVDREVAVGAMKGMAEDVPLFDLVRGLDIPKFTINAADRPMDEVACREAGIDVRYLPTGGHFVMNEDSVGFNRMLSEVLEGMR